MPETLPGSDPESAVRCASRWARPILLLCAGLAVLPAFGQVTDAQARALAGALKLAAPHTDRPGLYSDWKVKPAIIPDWSRRCLGKELTPEQFAADAAEARRVVECVAARELTKQLETTHDESLAVRRSASWWMTGDPDQYDQGATAAYTQRVLFYYRELLPR
jgi:hypothetical protein